MWLNLLEDMWFESKTDALKILKIILGQVIKSWPFFFLSSAQMARLADPLDKLAIQHHLNPSQQSSVTLTGVPSGVYEDATCSHRMTSSCPATVWLTATLSVCF